MYELERNLNEFFSFKNNFKITELHNFHSSFGNVRQNIKHLPEKYILVVLRNGIGGYRIENGKIIERVSGSIIGEKTILNIMEFKFPGKTTK